MSTMKLLQKPTRHLFFTGKGGVGKTSLSCATAIALADQGLRILLVSTDPASNLDEMLGVNLGSDPTPVPGVPRLFAMNIDPETAAEDYRLRVLGQMGPDASDKDRATVREQLSGACTTEIAAFDEFVGLLADDDPRFDHIIFDTAPTGHTLRLLSLPKAWTGFLEANERGASCLGPHSGLKMQEDRFRTALECLGDPARTTIVLVTRADRGAIREAARTAGELSELGLSNQMLAINGRFAPSDPNDPVAAAFAAEQTKALADLPATLASLPRDEVALKPFDMVGLAALRGLLSDTHLTPPADTTGDTFERPDLPRLSTLIGEIAASGKGLVMVMGKGGVGKTTVAAAVVAIRSISPPPIRQPISPSSSVPAPCPGSASTASTQWRKPPATSTRSWRPRAGIWMTPARLCCARISPRPAPKKLPSSTPSPASSAKLVPASLSSTRHPRATPCCFSTQPAHIIAR